jgi:signal transduction histidine kinase
LEEYGLAVSLDTFCEQMRHTWLPPVPEIVTEIDEGELPMPIATVLLRVAQECLRNVRRHAGAGTVRLMLRYTPDSVEMVIEDDGAGFAVPPHLTSLAAHGHFGLLGLAEQLDSVGGTLDVQSSPQPDGHAARGTTVTATIPLPSGREK